MKPEEVELCREAFKLYEKGYRILTRAGKNKGEYTAYQIRLENKTELFEKLKKVIPESIIKQINTSNKPNRCICLIGKDSDLIDGVVSYILHFHDFKVRFSYRNYTGVNSGDVEAELFKDSLLSWYFRGESLFLRNLEDVGILRRLASTIRDYMARDLHGFLFVSVENVPDLPEEFKSLFDVIELESEKQKTPAKTPRGAKSHYIDPKEFDSFLREINTKYEKLSLGKKANMAISEIEGRGLWLKNGRSIYKKKTIINKLSSLFKLKKDGKKTEK